MAEARRRMHPFWVPGTISAWPLGCLFFFVVAVLAPFEEVPSILASDVVQFSPHLGVCVLLLCLGEVRGVGPRELCRLIADPLMVFFFASYAVAASLSLIPIVSLSLVGALLLFFFLGRMCISIGTDEEILQALALTSMGCVLTTFLLLSMPMTEMHQHRVLANRGFGEISMLGTCLALAITKKWLRWLTFALGVTGILIVESRASLLGLAAGVFVVWYLPSLRALLRIGAVLAVAVCFVVSIPALRSYTISHVETTLALNDRYRGLGTGFTGRTETWKRGLSEVQESPFLGTGPRTQKTLANSVGEKAPHNGYLITLLEVGFVGFLATAALFARRLLWNWHPRNRTRLNRVLATATVAFLADIFFQPCSFSRISPVLIVVILWLELGRPAARLSSDRSDPPWADRRLTRRCALQNP